MNMTLSDTETCRAEKINSQLKLSILGFFHSCTVHSDVIQSFIIPTIAQPVCFKILKFTLKYTINAPTCFGLSKPSSGSLQSVLS